MHAGPDSAGGLVRACMANAKSVWEGWEQRLSRHKNHDALYMMPADEASDMGDREAQRSKAAIQGD